MLSLILELHKMQNFKSNKCIETHIVVRQQEKTRLQDYGVSIFKSIQSKSALKKALKKGLISRDNEIAKTSDWVEKGQVYKLYAEEIQHKKVFKLKFDVLFEDDDVAIINKPSGYPTNGNYFKTIENALPFNLEESNADDKLPFPQTVHRLDNPTSGLLLVAKTLSSKSQLSVMFEQHQIQKHYLAIIEGELESSEGEFNSDIDEKSSLTKFQVKNVFERNGKSFSLIDLEPHTGRTHQLRIHLSSKGNPIIGDSIYGSRQPQNQLLLNAYALHFVHPKTHKRLHIETDLPHKFVKFIGDIK